MCSSDFLSLSDFDFHVPQSQIAQEPLPKRDDSKLLVYKDGEIWHQRVHELMDLIPEHSLLVVNDTQVFPSRLLGKTEDGKKCEVFLLKKDEFKFEAFVKPAKKMVTGTRIYFAEGLIAEVMSSEQSSKLPFQKTICFNLAPQEVQQWLYSYAYTPLPPYIKRIDPKPWSTSQDTHRYQTVYAKHEGSVAAPTAGLHFTQDIFLALEKKSIRVMPVTLHVGVGTFAPVRDEDIALHDMHEEQYFVPKSTYEAITSAQAQHQAVIAIGTTSLRALESLNRQAQIQNQDMLELCDQWLKTNLFIYPKHKEDRFRPWAANAIITNFHQPTSTLFMLICSLIGFEAAHKLYRQAIEHHYRFYSYGDTSLLWLR